MKEQRGIAEQETWKHRGEEKKNRAERTGGGGPRGLVRGPRYAVRGEKQPGEGAWESLREKIRNRTRGKRIRGGVLLKKTSFIDIPIGKKVTTIGKEIVIKMEKKRMDSSISVAVIATECGEAGRAERR